MHKGKRYNFIVVLLLFIISAVVGVSAGMGANPANSLTPGVEDQNTLPDEPDTPEPPSDLKAPSSSAKPLTKLLFAIDVLNNGKGFRSETVQTLLIETLNVKQHMRFTKHTGGGVDVVQEWFEFEGPGMFAGSGRNDYRVQYSDGTNMYSKTITDKSKIDFASKTVEHGAPGEVEQFTVDNYVNAQNRFPLNDFFVNVDERSAGTISEDKRSDPNNYIITVNMSIAGLSQKYLNTFTANGGDTVELETLTLTFRISKKTGFLRSVQKHERFKSTYKGISLASSWCTTTLTETFHEMNVSKEAEARSIASKSFNL